MNGKIIRGVQSDVLRKELRKRIKRKTIKDNQFALKMMQMTNKKN